MKNQLASLLRHAFTALAGLGALLFSKGLIDQADVPAVNGAGLSLGNALVVILAAVIGRLLLTLFAKLFRTGSGETAGETGSGGSLKLLAVMGTAAALMGGLPSCSPFLSAARAIPVKTCVLTDAGTFCYSAKDGLTAAIDARSGK